MAPNEDTHRSPAWHPDGSDDIPQRAPMSIDRFSHLVGCIYDTAQDSANWSACLEELRREFAGNYASLIVRRGSAHDFGFIISAAAGQRVVDVRNPYISLSPFSGLRPEKIVTINDVLSPDAWRASQYYKDWCEPHGVFHVMAVDISIHDLGVYGFRITRSPDDPPFSAADRALCEKMVPHLKRALSLYASFHNDRQVYSLYRHAMGQLMVGVFVLDENGQIIESNAMANAILQLADGITVTSKKLGATYAADNRKLQQLVQKVLGQRAPASVAMVEAMSINRPSGRVAWGLVAQAITADEWTEGKHRPCVAIFVRDSEGKSEPPMRLAQQLFQLTPAETSLAIQLANGLSLDEASEVLNIRRNTARAHLRSIFSKTGVRRQTELVRIFLNSVALLGNNE